MSTKKQVERNTSALQARLKERVARLEGLEQGIEMVESFFKEYYDQISDLDPFVDARVNVLKEVKSELKNELDIVKRWSELADKVDELDDKIMS